MSSPHLSLDSTQTLSSGIEIPKFGLGVFKLDQSDTGKRAIIHALQHGYRHIDTAAVYKNEETVGEAIRESGLPRESIFVTTKVWYTELGQDKTTTALDTSLQRLGLDFVDLYLIHWPADEHLLEGWEAMRKLRDVGKIRSIGVSNFTIERFEKFLSATNEVPDVNQVELHLFHQQRALVEYCTRRGMILEAYCPLARANRFDNPVLQRVAGNCGKSPAQVMLRWCLQKGFVTIPKSQSPARIEQNADIYDFELSEDQMKVLAECDGEFEASTWRPNPETWY